MSCNDFTRSLILALYAVERRLSRSTNRGKRENGLGLFFFRFVCFPSLRSPRACERVVTSKHVRDRRRGAPGGASGRSFGSERRRLGERHGLKRNGDGRGRGGVTGWGGS